MNHPFYEIVESKLVTRRLHHQLLGEIGVIEDQSDDRVLVTTFGTNGKTEFYDTLELAFNAVNKHVITALEVKMQDEIAKIRAYTL